jgi:micrococcal nuclease
LKNSGIVVRAAALILVVAVGVSDPSTARSGPRTKRAMVTRVVDGDTVTARRGSREVEVRLLGVDTPETVHPTVSDECFAAEASRFTRKKLEGKRVRLEFDRERLDRYERTLAYVWLGRRLFNVTLVRRGFATVLIYQPNDRYARRLERAERAARRNDRGVWGACGHGGGGGGGGGEPAAKCDPSYPTVCIPPPPPDLDCADVRHRRFQVRGSDPHGFDGDGDGVGCET